MKFVFTTFLLLLSSFVGFSQSAKVIRTYGIEKKVKTIVKYEDSNEVSRYIEEIELYNKEGDWVEKRNYTSDGELKLHRKRIYEDDEVVEEIEIDLNGSGFKEAQPPSYARTVFEYEKGEPVSEKELSESGDLIFETVFEYNSLGDLVKESTKDGLGDLVKIKVFEYDSRGLKVKEQISDGDGNLLKEKRYLYE